jgi:glycosyltransferase involved in cell wall biosynthesis
MAGAAIAFDLVVATLDRSEELDRLFQSLDRQSHRGFRVVVVDQNQDERVETVLARHPGLDVRRLRSHPGLSRARNVGLGALAGDVVGFPDDDCVYPDDLLERLAARFAERPELDGISGRPEDADGTRAARWPDATAAITPRTVWNRTISHTLFLRKATVERIGGFDESLGLGSGRRWHSGEEIDFLVRALRQGAQVEYDPSFVVIHPQVPRDTGALLELGARDGASVGYILRKHRYPLRTVASMLVRPLGGAALSLLAGDVTRARFHARTLAGRIRGYRARFAA